MFDEDDYLIDLVFLKALKFGYKIASYLFVEGGSPVVQFLQFGIVGDRIGDVVGYILKYIIEIHVDGCVLVKEVAVGG
ncbi:MAG: hypothetical protein KDD45_09340 [Bdellovibrionales bacterium]|nr:hypothetical protein [Bdellovibrionales bacterium]